MTQPSHRGIGSRLREAREHKGIPIRQIANTTKISVRLLEALERDDIAKLPGGLFSRAFVRAYAHEVGLDPDDIVHDFMLQFPDDGVSSGHPSMTEQILHADPRGVHRRPWMTLWQLAVAGLTIAIFVYAVVAKPDWRRWVLEQASTTFRSSGPPSPTPTSGAVAAARPPRADREPVVAVVSVIRPTVLTIVVDGRSAVQGQIAPGEARTLAFRSELALTTSDAGSVTLSFNGEPIPPLGQTGQPVTARFSADTLDRYVATR
jgi:cytoskeletal protein RodZ